MERQLWKAMVVLLGRLDKGRRSTRRKFTDVRIAEEYSWAVIHDRPVCWSCVRANWPLDL